MAKIIRKLSIINKHIIKNDNKWSFGNNIARRFEKHIIRSIPMYKEGHELVIHYSDYFLNGNSVVYDLGCSTGNLLKKFSSINKKVKFVGIDIESQMISYAKKNNASKNVAFISSDIIKHKIKKSDVIIAYYSIQFIHPKYRQKIFTKIYKSLNEGGCFFLFEKIRGNSAKTQDIFNGAYDEYKLSQGFDPEEIFVKTRSLKGVLKTLSSNENKSMLKKSGFNNIEVIFKYNCFEGLLAIK